MTITLHNGKVRKSLADQLDRLDRTLDGLADNLDQAVASAVKQAVQVVLLEVLGMMVAEVSRRTWARTVEVVGAGVDVLTGVLVLVLDGQALGIAEASH